MNTVLRRYSTIARKSAAKKYNKCACHIYEQNVFSSWRELVSHLSSNVIYNDKNLVMINKPYGLQKEPFGGIDTKNGTMTNRILIVGQSTEVNFADAIPYLTKDLQIQNLNLVKVPERYTSGVSILSSDPAITKKVKEEFSLRMYPISTYLAVCIGIPLEKTNSKKLGLTIVTKNNRKKAIFIQNYSKNSLKKKIVLPTVFQHQILSVNENLNVSLVRIENNRNKWHAVKAYCALRLLAPVLGDTIYSSCVRILNKKFVSVDPFSDLADFPMKLPENIISKLRLQEHENIIPTHLHLAEINFRKYHGGIRFVAKVPEHFVWTCERLNLTVPEDYLQNRYYLSSDIINDDKPSENIEPEDAIQ